MQSALNPHGPEAHAIAQFWWVMLAASCAIFATVMGLLIVGLFGGRRADGPEPLRPRAAWTLVIAGGIVVPVFILIGFVVWSASISRDVSALPNGDDQVVIQVIGHQWWWEVNYLDGERVVARSPNEMHIPLGRMVRVRLGSADVIHSFWIPNLTGKVDAIPGQVNELAFEATAPGVLRGQCAEFCGGPHALMSLLVIVEPAAEFDAWLPRQRQAPVAGADTARGLDVFLARGCRDCHRIEGTPADGRFGPDLSHIGSRRTLAAATLPNTIGHLGGWILDPDANKPGAKMPPTPLSPDELDALLQYLRSLE